MSTQNNGSKQFDVSEAMFPLCKVPIIDKNALLTEALEIMENFCLGMVCICNQTDELEGIITDGDVRRILSNVQKPLAALMCDDALSHSVTNPKTVAPNVALDKAINLMCFNKVWDLPVINNGKLVGLLHLHQAINLILGDDQ